MSAPDSTTSPGPESVWTPHIGRDVLLRPGTADRQVWADTFTGLYHLPTGGFTPSTVLDLGANIGLTTAHYQFVWPYANIVAVELDEGNAAVAAVNAAGAHILVAAAAARSGTRYYNPADETDAFHLARSGKPVPALTLVQIIGEYVGGPVDFAKMDIEGSEWEILENPDWVPLVRRLLVELHGTSAHANVARAIGLLTAAGYTATRHGRHPQSVFATR